MSTIIRVLIVLTLFLSISAASWHTNLKTFSAKLKVKGLHAKFVMIDLKINKDQNGSIETLVKDSRSGDIEYMAMNSFGVMAFAKSVISVHKIFSKEVSLSKKKNEKCVDFVDLSLSFNGKHKKLNVCMQYKNPPFEQQVIQWATHIKTIAKKDRIKTNPKSD